MHGQNAAAGCRPVIEDAATVARSESLAVVDYDPKSRTERQAMSGEGV